MFTCSDVLLLDSVLTCGAAMLLFSVVQNCGMHCCFVLIYTFVDVVLLDSVSTCGDV